MAGEHSLFGPVDPAGDAGYDEDRPKRKGFFTDTSICIGCKACEVACKEWNDVPADHFDMLGSSYDNSFSLNANQWRHVAFYDVARARIEMHLEASEEIAVAWPGGGRRFDAGERIHTENSCKHTVDGFRSLLLDAGFATPRHWCDRDGWFAVFWADAR